MFDTTCRYCKYFVKSPKTKKTFKGKTIRRCRVKGRRIHIDKKACDLFDPAALFHCDQFECQLAFANCLHRRGNRLKLKAWDDCKKCRQFEKELTGLIQNFFIEGRVPKDPPDEFKDKDKEEEKPKSKRTLKRRSKSPLTKALDVFAPKPRKIKRRQPRRKLKRRSKK